MNSVSIMPFQSLDHSDAAPESIKITIQKSNNKYKFSRAEEPNHAGALEKALAKIDLIPSGSMPAATIRINNI